MIIEFLGIPGSGKTYNANLYKQRLKIEGKRFIDISRHKRMPFWMKVLYKIADYFVNYISKYKKFEEQYIVACKGGTDKPKYFTLSLNKCIRDIVLASFIHNLFGVRNVIIINDEGQLQRIVTLAVQYNVKLIDLLQVYQTEKHIENTQYIEIPIEEAFSNIRQRNRHVCEMDELNDNELMLFLKDFDSCCRECMRYLNNID